MFVNFADDEAEITFDPENIGLWNGCGHGLCARDIFTNESSVISSVKTEKLAAHDSKVCLCKTVSL